MARMTELAAFLKAHDDFILLGHVSPDGDACGSCIALALALQSMGKRTAVYLPGGMPEIYKPFLCTAQVLNGEEPPFAPKTAFSVDVSEKPRLGKGEAIFDRCEYRCMLDHHPTNTGFGEVFFVDGEAAACGELAAELIVEMGVSLSEEMAQWLYIAIVTDCGQFGYSSTRPETMEAAALCLRAGVDADRISRELFRTRTEGRTRLLGMILNGMEMNEDKTMCWSRLTDDMLSAANALREDNEGAVNYLIEIRGVEFACLAEERGKSQTKFSLRSKVGLDVARAVAQPLGGGGHPNAAGVTLNLPMEEALERVLAQARTALNKG